MLFNDHRARALLNLGAGLVALATVASSQGAERYVHAKEGAEARVFQDANAKAVGKLAAGDLLRVHQEDVFDLPDGRRLAWLEVSSPKGFPVWVYGQYLAPTGADGIYVVTGNAVRMRPMPESSIASYPLRSTLRVGERVLMIERHDPSAALDQDWMHVWSPPTARAWVFAADTNPAGDMAAARRAWAQGLRSLPSATAAKSSDAGAPAGVSPVQLADVPKVAAKNVPDEAYRSLAFGNTLLDNARKKGKQAAEADFAPALRAYNVVLDMAPAGSQVAANAQRQKELALMLQEVAALRDDVDRADERNQARLAELQQQQLEAALEKTIHWGRFMGRGWVEKVKRGRELHWYLRWDGEIVYEIDCGTGRYDLSIFEGYQVGVMGSTVRAATPSTEEAVGEVALLDVSRIEVIEGGRR
jgi:hypothetical protein